MIWQNQKKYLMSFQIIVVIFKNISSQTGNLMPRKILKTKSTTALFAKE